MNKLKIIDPIFMASKLFNWRIVVSFALTLFSAAALAHEYAKADIFIDHPWARPGKAATVPAAVYFEIVNRGEAGDRLLSAKSARAEHVELHVSEKSETGIVSMRLLKDGLTVDGLAKVSMETGSYHVMLIGLEGKLRLGESFPMTLNFEKAGEIEILVHVEDRQMKADSVHAH